MTRAQVDDLGKGVEMVALQPGVTIEGDDWVKVDHHILLSKWTTSILIKATRLFADEF